MALAHPASLESKNIALKDRRKEKNVFPYSYRRRMSSTECELYPRLKHTFLLAACFPIVPAQQL
jgi:hypothetical protein